MFTYARNPNATFYNLTLYKLQGLKPKEEYTYND